METIKKTLGEFEASSNPGVIGDYLLKLTNDKFRCKHEPTFFTKSKDGEAWLTIHRARISTYSSRKVFTLQGTRVRHFENDEGSHSIPQGLGEAIRFELWPKSSNRTWVIIQYNQHESAEEDLSKVNEEYARYAKILKEELSKKAFKKPTNRLTLDGPEPPKIPNLRIREGGSFDEWFDWYHLMLESGFKITLGEIANLNEYSEGYIKSKHSNYMKESGI